MYSALKGTKNFLRRKKKIQDPRPDNFIFRLHYQFTFGFFAVACTLVTSYSYIDSKGSAIQCMADKGQVPEGVLNKYCWISATFTLPKHFKGDQNGDFIHHGVGPDVEGDEKIYHAYYQWVPLMLSLQAAMFYLPHWIWKQLEGGKLDLIIMGLNNANCDNKEAKIEDLSNYMKERLRDQYDHKLWAAKFYFCEFLNFVNVIFQILITDRFLGWSFSNYGLLAAQWSNLDPEDRVDPMSKVFPRMTKCRFDKFGSSGTIQNFDALCVLGMNIINEKIYVFLWFWLIFLAIATGINLIYRLVTLMVPGIRSKLVILEEYGLRHTPSQRADVEKILGSLTYPDWLILYYLAQCMDKQNFNLLVTKMCDRFPDDTHIEEEKDERAVNDSTLQSKVSLKNFLPMKKTSNV